LLLLGITEPSIWCYSGMSLPRYTLLNTKLKFYSRDGK
jgi:hypothetical protein